MRGNTKINRERNCLTQERDGSEEAEKYSNGDPSRGLNFFFPVSSCHTTSTPSLPPDKKKKNEGNVLTTITKDLIHTRETIKQPGELVLKRGVKHNSFKPLKV